MHHRFFVFSLRSLPTIFIVFFSLLVSSATRERPESALRRFRSGLFSTGGPRCEVDPGCNVPRGTRLCTVQIHERAREQRRRAAGVRNGRRAERAAAEGSGGGRRWPARCALCAAPGRIMTVEDILFPPPSLCIVPVCLPGPLCAFAQFRSRRAHNGFPCEKRVASSCLCLGVARSSSLRSPPSSYSASSGRPRFRSIFGLLPQFRRRSASAVTRTASDRHCSRTPSSRLSPRN